MDVAAFEPKVKRTLDIAPLIPEIAGWDGGRGGVWDGAVSAGELQRVSGDGEDGDLLEQWDAVRVVRVVCGYAERADCYGVFPGGRPADVRTEGG